MTKKAWQIDRRNTWNFYMKQIMRICIWKDVINQLESEEIEAPIMMDKFESDGRPKRTEGSRNRLYTSLVNN